jgi:hypothetical protein
MQHQPDGGLSKVEQRRLRIRRARIVTTVLSVVATVVLGVVLATSDPSRASPPAAAQIRTSPTSPAPDQFGSSGPSNADSGNGDNQYSNGGGGGGDRNLGSAPNTQTRGS